KWKAFTVECRRVTSNKRTFTLLFFIALLNSINWVMFIWAVQNGYVIQSSLGYYMNPLINILLGVLLLKEKLSIAQITAFILAFIAVAFLTIYYGVFSCISFTLSFSFGLYGLVKKIYYLHAIYKFDVI